LANAELGQHDLEDPDDIALVIHDVNAQVTETAVVFVHGRLPGRRLLPRFLVGPLSPYRPRASALQNVGRKP